MNTYITKDEKKNDFFSKIMKKIEKGIYIIYCKI